MLLAIETQRVLVGVVNEALRFPVGQRDLAGETSCAADMNIFVGYCDPWSLNRSKFT